MRKGTLTFYLLRLRHASFAELMYRAKHLIFVKRLKLQPFKLKKPVLPSGIDLTTAIKDLALPALDGEISERLSQKILEGKLFTLNADLTAIKNFEDQWRHTYFDDIKISDQNLDIRSVWEAGRLQHIAVMVHYVSRIQDTDLCHRVKQFIKNAIIKWINENPFPYGPHYQSVMECGLRIPLFIYSLKALDNLTTSESQFIFDTLYRHVWWVSKRLSLYSSLGNHTIAEATGLVFGGAVFRSTAAGRHWLAKGYGILKREFEHQILDDGGPAEQSLNYHRFVMDLYGLAIEFLDKNNLYDCNVFSGRLLKAEHFMETFEDAHGKRPLIGDSDDGHAVAPTLMPRRKHPNDKTPKIETFSKSGYTVVKDQNMVLTFDHGPLGMAPFYNHGHADALSITLSVAGQQVLVDPGTYRYNGEPYFRKYFKGTRAHNTVTVDGQDQAIQETGFIWSHAYNARLIKSRNLNDVSLIQAKHDGYKRYTDPVEHHRSLYIIDATTIIVKDSFRGEGVHKFELNFHLHPDMKVARCNEDGWHVYGHSAEIYLSLLGQNDFRVIKGRRHPMSGWFSDAYGIKCETSVLNVSINGASNTSSFTTAINLNSPFDPQDIIERISNIE